MRLIEKKAKKIPLDSGELSSGWFLERDAGLFRCIYMDEHIVIHNLKFVNGNGCSIWINM